MKQTLMFAMLLLSVSSCQNNNYEGEVADKSAEYIITVSEDKKTVKVEAEFSIDEKTIYMFVQTEGELKNGEASLIKNIILTNSKGEAVSVNDLGEGEWETGIPKNERVKLSYDVELNHEKYYWASGIDEVSYVREDGVFLTGKAFLIIPGQQMNNITVKFNLPNNWKSSTAWTETDSLNHIYKVASFRELLYNCMFLGTHDEKNLTIGGLDLKIVAGGKVSKSLPIITKIMESVLNEDIKLFGSAPSNNYLIVMHDDKMNDGGAFTNSFSQLIDGTVNDQSKMTWGHTMAHEIFHLWNGNSIRPADQEVWFKEGFTDYMTIANLGKSGVYSKSEILNVLENNVRKVVIHDLMNRGVEPVSLKNSGDKKDQNRLLVYGGGHLTALMLDIEMREKSNGKVSLNDLMKRMFQEFGTTGKRYTMTDIISLTNSLTGSDLTSFFEETVNSTKRPDIKPYLTKLGLQMDTFVEEIYISKRTDATEKETQLFQSIYGMTK